ncbi:MAG: DUF6383 domain-containing protein, partial [Tannerella sp.]|nr:DUF6383 domain-containing protein [Tannerella sp.]
LNTQIRLGYASACTATDDNPKATIGNDLYLIRNAKGEYLCVPIWSITCQAYWVTPRDYEDPTRMPCYQWAIENKRAGAGSPFKLTNREFEHVSLPYAYVFASNTEPLYYQGGSGLSAWAAYDPTTGGPVGDPTNIVYAGVVPASKAIGKGQFATIEQLYPFKSTKYSFFPLAADVKSDQLLGYNYIDADSALVDVYAFKYRHYAATGADARYVGWEGYSTGGADTTVYVVYNRPSDRLFFSLEEMPLDIIQDWVWINKDYDYTDNLKPYYVPNGGLFGYRRAGYNDYEDYKSIYNLNVLGKSNLGYNQNGITLEHFGYMPTKYNTTIGNDVYKYYTEGIVGIPDLKPLARQAYRLLLKDYYKFHPTVKGDYLTVGAQDNYVLADNDLVGIKYTPGITDDPSGMFGTPYYYFRNTYFDVPGVSAQGDAVTQTYFAVIQRLDTLTLYTSSNGAFSTPYSDVLQYITVRFGTSAATQIASAVEDSHELGVFIWDVEEHDKVRLKVTTRGEAAYRLNTFTLERDTDPIYRRFHWNEPDYSFPRTLSDEPLILEFHTLGNEKVKLFENSGADKTSGGGYEYNCPTLSDGTLGDQFTDSLGNIISFLGVKNISTHPSVVLPDKWGLNEYANNRDVKVKGTNYWFYVDTAYINRGTGWIKPQYMLVVDPKIVPDESVCADTNPSTTPTTYKGYVIGRYMYNTAMYAKKIVPLFEDDYEYGQWIYAADGTTKISPITGTGINYDLVQPIEDKLTAVVNPQYMENVKITARGEVIPGGWERIAFSWAIHVGDELFILKGAAPFYKEQLPDVELLIADLSKYYGPDNGRCIDFAKLRAVKGLPLSSINAPIGVHAIIDLSNNQHKDWVWSFRYVERGSSNFVIESETTDRDRLQGKEIRPGYGGWVKIDLDMIPGITRNDMRPDLMGEGDIFDVKDKTAEVEISDVVANESLSVVKVIGGNGEVTITNAAGKTVVVNNILGQTLTNTTISSDKATFKVPAGIVFVSVEGEKSVKALVK